MSGGETRAAREIAHGRLLAQGDTEQVWGWGTPGGRVRFRRRADEIASGADLKPGMRALELGCGTGLFTREFARTGAEIVAIDISPDLLDRARAAGADDGVTWVLGRFEDAALPGPFDAVVGSSVLHHLDLEPSLRRILELLKPGGRLSFAEPNFLNPQVFAERTFRFLPPFRSYVSPDETAFVRGRLARDLARAGFDAIAIEPFDWVHPSTPAGLVPLVARVGRALEQTPLLREGAGSLVIRGRRPR